VSERDDLMQITPEDYEWARSGGAKDARLLAAAALVALLLRWSVGPDGLPQNHTSRFRLLVVTRRVLDAYRNAA
jgi:hypothetical protein